MDQDSNVNTKLIPYRYSIKGIIYGGLVWFIGLLFIQLLSKTVLKDLLPPEMFFPIWEGYSVSSWYEVITFVLLFALYFTTGYVCAMYSRKYALISVTTLIILMATFNTWAVGEDYGILVVEFVTINVFLFFITFLGGLHRLKTPPKITLFLGLTFFLISIFVIGAYSKERLLSFSDELLGAWKNPYYLNWWLIYKHKAVNYGGGLEENICSKTEFIPIRKNTIMTSEFFDGKFITRGPVELSLLGENIIFRSESSNMEGEHIRVPLSDICFGIKTYMKNAPFSGNDSKTE
jgi:hypothetical protein